MKATQRQEIRQLSSSRIRTISRILALAVIFSLAASSGTLHATQIPVKRPLSPEVLAMHARTKRSVATGPTSLELTTSNAVTTTTFNSDQGPGPGPIGPGPGCNLYLPTVRPSLVHTLGRVLRRPIRAWSGRFNC